MLFHYLVLSIFATICLGETSITENNDTALEYLNNCKCVLDIHCYKGNLNIRGIGIITIRNNVDNQTQTTALQCSKPSYVCCRDQEEIVSRNVITVLAAKPEQNLTSTNQNHTTISKKSDDQCGIQKPTINIRIFTSSNDMSTAIDGEFPWMVSIHRKSSLNDTFQFKCAGSLITDIVVLTAAHCVHSARKRPLDFKILANAKTVLGNIGDNSIQEREAERIVVHPEYYAGGAHNDIALIILKKSYNESRRLNNVCLPQLNSTFDSNKCIATGWGIGNNDIVTGERILRKVELPIMDHEKCEQLLRKTRLGNDFKLHLSFICAGGEKGRDTCKGDGGGPLICPNEEGVFIQAGIVSWGIDCAKENHPGVYTDVTKFSDWIKTNIEQNNVVKLNKNI